MTPLLSIPAFLVLLVAVLWAAEKWGILRAVGILLAVGLLIGVVWGCAIVGVTL